VVVKGHSAHPGTGELVAPAVDKAIKKHKLHPGVFSLIRAASAMWARRWCSIR
jgi:NADP-dependent aldehyde dehydrogenase